MNNPYSAHLIAPGKVPYLAGSGPSLDELARAFEASGFQAQIVGPHGSGKSTLSHELARRFQGRFSGVRWLTVRRPAGRWAPVQIEEQRQAPPEPTSRPDSQRWLTVVDGVEALGLWGSGLLIRSFQRRRLPLLLTTHRRLPWRLPVIARLKPDENVFRELVWQLGASTGFHPDPESLSQTFHKARGDCREALFAVYDRFEEERQAKPCSRNQVQESSNPRSSGPNR